MKTFQHKIGNFFKWVKGTELVELTNIDVNEDPVRPNLDLEWRNSYGRKIYGLRYEEDIEAIVCVAFTNEIPKTEKELDLMSENAFIKKHSTIAIAYTVWSRKRGAGREIITKLREWTIQHKFKRLVTLSPLTPMATHFHIKNGAKQVHINEETQNFEYKL